MKVADQNSEQRRFTWIQFKEGNKEAFAKLYNLYIDHLFSYGLKICSNKEIVKDAVQEIFIDLFLRRKKITTSPDKLNYYLILALKRNLIKKIKSERRFYRGEIIAEKADSWEFSVEYDLMVKEQNEEIRQKIVETLKLLPEKQKEAIYLRFNESMDYPEISKIMGITIESSRKQIYRALKRVRNVLDREEFTILFYILEKIH